MARWTVVDGDQEFVLESQPDGRFRLEVTAGGPFVTGTDGLRDLRRKLGLAIGDSQTPRTPTGNNPTSQHKDTKSHRGGEESV